MSLVFPTNDRRHLLHNFSCQLYNRHSSSPTVTCWRVLLQIAAPSVGLTGNTAGRTMLISVWIATRPWFHIYCKKIWLIMEGKVKSMGSIVFGVFFFFFFGFFLWSFWLPLIIFHAFLYSLKLALMLGFQYFSSLLVFRAVGSHSNPPCWEPSVCWVGPSGSVGRKSISTSRSSKGFQSKLPNALCYWPSGRAAEKRVTELSLQHCD